MSEYLQNQEYKQQILKRLITDLHRGRDFEEVKGEFNKLLEHVDATEIASMEQQLIKEGMRPEEIKKLCDVHAAVFRDALEKNEVPELVSGHPLYSIKHENDEARKLLQEIGEQVEQLSMAQAGEQKHLLELLQEKFSFFHKNLALHYSKKENILFPYLEKHDITGPPSVMWSVDDEIRELLKKFSAQVSQSENNTAGQIKDNFVKLKEKVEEMFFKEEDILTPMLRDAVTEEEWAEIKEQELDFGVVFSEPPQGTWQPKTPGKLKWEASGGNDYIELDTGVLTHEQVNTILTNLPVDITFVDENDEVCYFSDTKDRVFTRTKAIIGRKVQNCHPPESVHVVEQIVNDFKSGKHHHNEFWLELNGRFIYIQYFALRDHDGNYKGAMEVSQDITRARSLQGERRLLKYDEDTQAEVH